MPPITQEGQNAKNRIAEFRQNINNGATAKEARATVRQIEAGPTAPAPLTSTVSAKSLVNPPTPVTVSAPVVPPPPAPSPLVAPVRAETDNIIRANTEESKRLQELRDQYSVLNDQGSLSDLFNTQKQELGITDDLKELKDIQLRLTDNNTASELTKTRIEGGAGQTLGQAQREVTQEDRENAVRSSGLAARAAVLQGNIETATALAKDTVDMAFKDRQITAQNLINQINDIRSTVDEQTGQLLEQDKRKYEAELAAIKELKDNIATAMVNGASQAEIGQLNDPNMDDASKLALAQSITARGATQMRNLEIQSKQANIAQSYASVAASNTNRLLSLAEAGDANAIKNLGFDPRSVAIEIDPVTKRQLESEVTSTDTLIGLTQQYRDLVKANGFENTAFGNQDVVGQYRALRTQITAAYKDAKTLGSLDAGLLTLVDGILGEEPTAVNPTANIFGGRSTRIVNQLETFIDGSQKEKAQKMLRLGINPQTTGLGEDDNAQIDAAFGTSTTAQPFNPANFF